MIDPVSAIAVATTAFNTVKNLVNAGREFEDVVGQLGKWYTAAADISRAEQQRKNPPLYKKFLAKGSVEEEALMIITHQKKLKEQEDQLRVLLDYRYGYGTWDEMIKLRRKIRQEREKQLYEKQERNQEILDFFFISLLIAFISALVGGGIWIVGDVRGWWN